MTNATTAGTSAGLQVLTQANAAALLGQERLVVVDFWAAWCGPCRQFAPVFAQAAKQFPEVVFLKCDTEAQEALAAKHEIRSIPTLMAFRGGKVVQRDSGAMAAPALAQFIARAASVNPHWVSTDTSPWAWLERREAVVRSDDDEDEADTEPDLFSSVMTLSGAIRRGLYRDLAAALNGQEAEHAAVLAELAPAYLWLLVQGHPALSTLTANAAQHLVTQGAFEPAWVLYDAVVETEMDPGVAANPLYAVQDDNHHLGVDAPRARRYLERCLPHAPANPPIWLNAACVQMELRDPDGALESLALAKQHGCDLGPYFAEKLFVPVKADPRFLALQGKPAPRKR